jgi:hypothetical protein
MYLFIFLCFVGRPTIYTLSVFIYDYVNKHKLLTYYISSGPLGSFQVYTSSGRSDEKAYRSLGDLFGSKPWQALTREKIIIRIIVNLKSPRVFSLQ